MPLSKTLRGFVLADAFLTTVNILIGFMVTGAAQEEPGESFLYVVVSGTVLVAWLVARVGLWGFRSWARALYLIVAGVGVVGTLLAGGEAASGLEAALSSVCWLVTGVIIALVYWSPLAATFRSDVRPA